MLAKSRTKTNVGIAAGFTLFLMACVVATNPAPAMFVVFLVCAAVAFTYACREYARGKGYSGTLGLLGVVGYPGFLVLTTLRDKFACCETGGELCTHHTSSAPAPTKDRELSRAA